MNLYPHQIKAIEKLKNGSILCGDVGTGKSRTALAYYYTKVCCGNMEINGEGSWGEPVSPRDLIIITTAKKRDSLEWESECVSFMICKDPDKSICGIKLIVDSWNNIKKYCHIYGSFFIFDEQRVSGSGAWVKAFLQIVKKNQWILLSATPGDSWKDYIPVFMANGFYRTKSEFYREHCVMSTNPYITYPKIEGYTNETLLRQHRNDILVRMKYKKMAEQIHKSIMCNYDKASYMRVFRDRWDIYDEVPIDETGKLMYLLRKVVNSDSSRIDALNRVLMEHSRVIVFYNYTYEIDMIKMNLANTDICIAEWNGIKHEEVPDNDRWIYLVQYSAGAEGWNCITTDTIVFYSQNYSYRMTIQAAGRIDRMNTPFSVLYYYHFKSPSPIDAAIARSLTNKKNFNERAFLGL